jgi:hypothetical protein
LLERGETLKAVFCAAYLVALGFEKHFPEVAKSRFVFDDENPVGEGIGGHSDLRQCSPRELQKHVAAVGEGLAMWRTVNVELIRWKV